jgi:hypothetical protein
MPSSTRSTAARLLEELLNDGAFTAEGIATRLGHSLQGQVLAALRYESGATVSHLNDPPRSHRT